MTCACAFIEIMAASTSSELDEPHQPRTYSFPKRSFGQKNVVYRAFQAKWFDSYSWLHYDEGKDLAFCFLCMKAQNSLKEKCTDNAFISRGFSNWKDALASFRKHEESKCHKEAVDRVLVIPSTCKDCSSMLSNEHTKIKANSRLIMSKIMSSIKYLARQSLPLRGDGNEDDGNFIQLLKLRSIDDSSLANWISRKQNKYTSPEIQNEI